MTQNGRINPGFPEVPAGRHGRDAIGEFHLTNRAQPLRSGDPVHCVGFGVDSRPNVMPAAYVGLKFIEQIGKRLLPQMVMGVDNWQIRLKCRLVMTPEPFGARYRIT